MKAIILFESKSGFSEKYARWIAEAPGCIASRLSDFDPADLAKYDTVVFGGGLYAVGINGMKKFRELMRRPEAAGKRVAVFATGASPAKEEVLAKVRDANLSEEERNKFKFFYLRGGFDYSRLNKTDKLAMSLLKLKIKLTPEKKRVADERGMLAAYAKPVDFTRKKNLRPLLAWLGILEAHVKEPHPQP